MRHLNHLAALVAAVAITGAALPAAAASSPARAEAMAKLSYMSGVWRGPASGVGRDMKPFEVTQTERMGPMLDGDIIVIEGRGYGADGKVAFNAFGIVSWDPTTQEYEIRSYASGYSGTFELKLTADGYIWEIPAGPGAAIRYTATVADDTWREVGDYVAGDAAPQRIFEMNLKRVGDTTWPSADPVPMQ
jgi:hypothetical protein